LPDRGTGELSNAATDAGIAEILRRVAEIPRSATVLIDGPSGSGKTTLADRLLAAWPAPVPQLLRLDWMYPGWNGLLAASRSLVDDVLIPRASGIDGRWRRWDWNLHRPGEWSWLRADVGLVVEGCGALRRRPAGSEAVCVWIEADEAVRRERALARDAGGFDAHWEMWDAQWREYVRREHPARSADVRIDVAGSTVGG
jgi:hypothetical protein